jgi:hypothetical protein
VGQKISGIVTYILDKPFLAEKLTIELKGKECHIWEGNDDNHMNKNYPGKICIKNTILKMSVVLEKFRNNKADPGRGEFSFSFQLPNDLPPSFVFVGP